MKVGYSHLNTRFKDVLILMNKYYPSFKWIDGNLTYKEFIKSDTNKWEDFVLLHQDSYFNREGDILNFSIPVFYQMNNKLYLFEQLEDGISFYVDINHDNEEILINSIYPNVFVNTNYFHEYKEDSGWQNIPSNQELAAVINRKNLSNFLIDLERLLNSEIYDFGSYIIEDKFLNKYGINEDAVLMNI